MKKNQRRQSDHWTKKAKRSGFQARSVFKLEEMDKKFGVLKGKRRVLDLGCCPGSWSQYVYRRLDNALLMGIDIQPTPSYPGHFVQMSIEDLTADLVTAQLKALPDLIISDMAPSTIGQKQTDHLRQIALAEMALDLVERVLIPGGVFVVKVFDGKDAPAFITEMRRIFTRVKRFKPKATRGESVEFFLIGFDKKVF